KGTQRAITTLILSIPGVQFATTVEPFDGTGIVYVGDANYTLPAAALQLIQAGLLDWRGFGVPMLVRPYNATVVPVTATVYMSRSLSYYNMDSLRSAAFALVQAYFQNLPRPDEYYVSA